MKKLLVAISYLACMSLWAYEVPVTQDLRTIPLILADRYEGKTTKKIDALFKKGKPSLNLVNYGCRYDELMAFRFGTINVAVLSLEELYYMKLAEKSDGLKSSFKVARFAYSSSGPGLKKYHFLVYKTGSGLSKRSLYDLWRKGVWVLQNKKEEAKKIFANYPNGASLFNEYSKYQYKRIKKKKFVALMGKFADEFLKKCEDLELYKKATMKPVKKKTLTSIF